MIYFTKYSESKFDILNKFKVFFTKEQIEDTIANPQKSFKKRKCLAAQKDGIKVLYKKDDDIIKIITFYPVK